MSYLVVLRFNSALNARQFVQANPGINPQIVNSSLSDGTYVVSTPDLLSQMPQGDMFPGPQYLPVVTYNPQGYIINYQPGFNLNDLTLTTPDGKTIISQGVPSTDVTDQPPPPAPNPFDPYQPTDPTLPPLNPYKPYNPQNPINPDLPIQPPAQDPNQVPIPKPFNPYNPFNPIDPTLPIDPQLVQMIYPDQRLMPQPLSQVPSIEGLPPGEIPEINYNPYLLTPQPLSDVPPPDYLPFFLPPPGITDPRVIPVSDYPMDPNVLRDPNLNPDLIPPPSSDQKPNYYDLPQPPQPPGPPDLFDPNLMDLYFYPSDINPEPWSYQYDSRTDIPGPQEGRYYYTPETPGDVPGLVIPVPPSFDPGMNIGKHRQPLRQPISGQGGGSAPGVLGVHFNGATGLYIPAVSSSGTARVSFSMWIRSAWTDPNPPIFIVDPGPTSQNNNNPQLEAVGGGGGFNNILLESGNQIPFGQNSALKCQVSSGVLANAWTHMMGSVDGSSGIGAFLVNGVSAGTTSTLGGGTQPFSSQPISGKPLYIGLDTLLDFFTGDIFALGIWLDVSFLSGSSIPQSTINLFYNNGSPIIPFTGAAVFGPPTAFLTGPAGRALSSPILGTQQLFYSQGQLTTSTVSVSLGL